MMTNVETIKQKLNELGRDEITHSEIRELVENYERAASALFLIECMAKKALLINIQPIKKDTVEDVLSAFVSEWDFGSREETKMTELKNRAKTILEKK